MFELSSYPIVAVFFIGLTVILVISELGWQLGIRTKGGGGGNITTLESAMLGLLALMLAFTFSMALTRFEARRDALLNEANAIGTTALRARLLPDPHRSETLKLLREYVDIRLDIVRQDTSLAERIAIVDRSNALQEALWQQAKAIASKDSGLVPSGLFIASLNEMIDDQGKRLSALRNQVPNIVLITLFAIAAVAGGFAGYASAVDAQRTRLPVLVMGLLIAIVIFLIVDLDRPSTGFIKNNQQPMLDLAASIASFVD
ncbi:MAG: hypothetical protein ACJ8F3_11755 [Xanthobacteraceae bacterium]